VSGITELIYLNVQICKCADMQMKENISN